MRKTQTDRFYADHATAAFSDYGITFNTEEHSLEVQNVSADALRAAILGYLDSFRYTKLGCGETGEFLMAVSSKLGEVTSHRVKRLQENADS